MLKRIFKEMDGEIVLCLVMLGVGLGTSVFGIQWEGEVSLTMHTIGLMLSVIALVLWAFCMAQDRTTASIADKVESYKAPPLKPLPKNLSF